MAHVSLLAGRVAAASALVLALVACGGGDGSSTDTSPAETPPPTTTPAPPAQVKSLYALAPAQPASAPATASPGTGATLIAGQLDANSQELIWDKPSDAFCYDAYVVTALRSGSVDMTSTVLAAVGYPYGYGFPISMGLIQDGADLHAYGGNYVQDAIKTGIAVTRYTVDKDRQYIVVFKAFCATTPLRYTLNVGEGLRVEGIIDKQGEVAELPADPGGAISIANPRAQTLSRLIGQIGPVLQ